MDNQRRQGCLEVHTVLIAPGIWENVVGRVLFERLIRQGRMSAARKSVFPLQNGILKPELMGGHLR